MSYSSEDSSSSIDSFVVESPTTTKVNLKEIFTQRKSVWIYHPLFYLLSNLIGFLIAVTGSEELGSSSEELGSASSNYDLRVWLATDTGIAFIICGIWAYLHFDRQYQRQTNSNIKCITNNKIRYILYTLLAIIPIAWTIIWRIYGLYLFVDSEFKKYDELVVYSIIAFLHPILMVFSTTIIWFSLKFCCPLEPNLTVVA